MTEQRPSERAMNIVRLYEDGEVDEVELDNLLREANVSDAEYEQASLIVSGEMVAHDEAEHAEELQESYKAMEE
jgi:hypothetical protein